MRAEILSIQLNVAEDGIAELFAIRGDEQAADNRRTARNCEDGFMTPPTINARHPERISWRRLGVEVAEELVGTVDQVDARNRRG